jgi:hypothetical protein
MVALITIHLFLELAPSTARRRNLLVTKGKNMYPWAYDNYRVYPAQISHDL